MALGNRSGGGTPISSERQERIVILRAELYMNFPYHYMGLFFIRAFRLPHSTYTGPPTPSCINTTQYRIIQEGGGGEGERRRGGEGERERGRGGETERERIIIEREENEEMILFDMNII